MVSALAWMSTQDVDPYLANVLATEAHNRLQRAHVVAEHLGEGVAALDTRGRVTFLNPAAERILGCTRADLMGQDFCARVHAGDAHGAEECPILRVTRTRETVQSEEEDAFMRRDGTRFPTAFTAAPVVREGTLTGVVVVFRDVTARKRAQDALRESEARFRQLSEAAFEAIAVHAEGRVVDVNRACLRLFRYARDEVVGRPILDFVAPASRDVVRDAVRDGREGPYETVFMRRDGTRFIAEVRARGITHGGRPARVAALRWVRDVRGDETR